MPTKTIKRTMSKLIDFTQYFPNLEFDDPTHTYRVGKTKLTSVSKVISELYEPFDRLGMAEKYAKSRGFTVEQVLNAWDVENNVKTQRGSDVHQFAEDYAYAKFVNFTEPPLPKDKQELAVVQFWNLVEQTPHLDVVGLETKFYNEDLRIAGTADVLLQNNKTGDITIADFKTNAALHSDFDNGVLKAVGLKNDNFGKYTVQFSLYQLLLEGATPFKVKNRRLIWLRASKSKYDKNLYQSFSTENVVEPMRKYLKERLK